MWFVATWLNVWSAGLTANALNVLLRSTTSRRVSVLLAILRPINAFCANLKITACSVMISTTPRLGFARVAVTSRKAANTALMLPTVRDVLTSSIS